jgi:hypothetical protein
MKTLSGVCVLLAVLLFLQSVAAQKSTQNLVSNGDFEKFTGDVPDQWDVNNIPGTLTVVSPAKTGASGGRAVRIEVKDFYGSIIAGYTCQKNIETRGKDLKLTGHFAVQAAGKDQGVIILCFQNASGSTIGTAEEYIDDTKGKFIDFAKEIKAPAGAAAVHLRLTILPSQGNEKAHAGSWLMCDDVGLAAIAIQEKPVVQ